jgi:hypothetical protein
MVTGASGTVTVHSFRAVGPLLRDTSARISRVAPSSSSPAAKSNAGALPPAALSSTNQA